MQAVETVQAPKELSADLRVRLQGFLDKGRLFVLVGAKDQGKTALGYTILEVHHEETNRPCFSYRPPKPDLLPKWITSTWNMDDVPNGAVVLIDEASREYDQYSNRKPSNRKLANMLEIARQKNQTVLLINQTSKRINRDLLYPVDVFLLKQPTLFQVPEERHLIRDAYERVKEVIQVNEYVWYSKDVFEKGTFTKPPWYTEELSKAYADYTPEQSVEKSNPQTPVNVAEPKSKIPQLFSKKQAPARTQTSRNERRFDPAGLCLSAIVGTVGLLSLMKGGLPLAAVCLTLAALGLIYSHKHFDG